MMRRINNALEPIRPMLEAILHLRHRYSRLSIGAITNNWRVDPADPVGDTGVIKSLFDVFVESCLLGIRKPGNDIMPGLSI